MTVKRKERHHNSAVVGSLLHQSTDIPGGGEAGGAQHPPGQSEQDLGASSNVIDPETS